MERIQDLGSVILKNLLRILLSASQIRSQGSKSTNPIHILRTSVAHPRHSFNVEPESGSNFYMNNTRKVGKGQKTYLRRDKRLFLKIENKVYLLILFNFHAPGSGSAFPIRIMIRDSQINADP
jgi:hypothetical protein